MKIVIDPPEMFDVASLLTSTADSYDGISGQLRGFPPRMPVSLWFRVESRLDSTQSQLHQISARYNDLADDLERRALYVLLGIDSSSLNGMSFLLTGFIHYLHWLSEVEKLKGMSPEQVNEYLTGLSATEREMLVRLFPEVLGRLPGVPLDICVQANRILIKRELDAKRAELARLKEKLGYRMGALFLGPFVQGLYLRKVSNLEKDIARLQGWASEGRFFLFFDPSGDGQVAEIFVEDADALKTVKFISVVVPGVGSTMNSFDRDGSAERLFEAMRGSGADINEVGAVRWYGYNPPDMGGAIGAIPRAIDPFASGRTSVGAGALARFIEGIQAQPGTGKVTVVAHSLGSVVAADAITGHGMRPDNIVLMGSPGTSLTSHNIPEGVTVYELTNPSDVVAGVPNVLDGHGSEPRNEEAFIHLEPAGDDIWSMGHEYLNSEDAVDTLQVAEISVPDQTLYYEESAPGPSFA